MRRAALLATPAIGPLVVFFSALRPAPAAHLEGPPPAHTGGFGEPTCHICHDELPLDDPSGVLQLHGLDSPFEPGTPRTVTIVLTGYEMRAAGFQAAFRGAAGGSTGARAGRVQPLDERTVVVGNAEDGIEYIQHTALGSQLEDEFTQWSFTWTPPEGVEEVVLHAAANSANGDDSPLGDLIYTRELHIRRR